MKECSVKYKM